MLVLGLGLVGLATSAFGKLRHATLLRSTPAADARLSAAPDSVRLVFSEAVVAELSQISVTAPDATIRSLRVALDPRNSHVLLAALGPVVNGTHRVAWRIVSADGHPIAGNFSFSLIAPGADSSPSLPLQSQALLPTTVAESSAAAARTEAGSKTTPRLVSVLRGVGLGAMMAAVGLLLFGGAAGSRRNLNPSALVTRLLTLGALLLAGHMAAWLYHISPGRGLSETFGMSALTSTLGIVESARVLLAILALWAMTAGRRQLALILGLGCLVVSGTVGHSAAIQPIYAIPAKIVHLIAASVWLGGLLWLAWTFRRDVTAFRIEARRVSFVALLAVLAVVTSGVAQAYLFTDLPLDLFNTSYGRLVLAKISGLFILVLLGAYNRFRLVPHLDDSRNGRKLSRSVTQELVVMAAILVISGFLANVPVPAPALVEANSSSPSP